MADLADVTSVVTIRGSSWTSTQHRDILTAAYRIIERQPFLVCSIGTRPMIFSTGRTTMTLRLVEWI